MPPSKQAHSTSSGLARWFAEEVQPCEAALRSYLLKRFPSVPDHDDLVQETYVRTLRAKESGRLTHTKGFLFTTARHAAIDLIRRRRGVSHEAISELNELPLLDDTPGVAESIDRQQRHEALIEAVLSLPERCREVMILRYLDGLAYNEIASRLGISPETVKVHIVKGVRDCTNFFQQGGLLEAVASVGSAVA